MHLVRIMHNIYGAFGLKCQVPSIIRIYMIHIYAICCLYTNMWHSTWSPCMRLWPIYFYVFASILCIKTALCGSMNSYINEQDTMHAHDFSSSYEQPVPSICIPNTMSNLLRLEPLIAGCTCCLDTMAGGPNKAGVCVMYCQYQYPHNISISIIISGCISMALLLCRLCLVL